MYVYVYICIYVVLRYGNRGCIVASIDRSGPSIEAVDDPQVATTVGANRAAAPVTVFT